MLMRLLAFILRTKGQTTMATKPLKNRDLNDFGIESSLDIDDEYLKPASNTDCTGLISSMPETEYQKDAYNEICNYNPSTYTKKIRKNDPIEM